MKRTPWLTWRLYFLTIPVDVLVIFFSADHTISDLNEYLRWVLVALIAHTAIAPVTAIALRFTIHKNSWKAELLALIILGAVRGLVINIAIGILDLEQKVPSLYKVFNSAISLPLWFIGLAIFVESRRQFQREFELLFLKSVREQQSSVGKQTSDADGRHQEKLIARLQSVSTGLANEIKKVLELPPSQNNYAQQAYKIHNLINKELRPASVQLWKGSALVTPKLSIAALLRISLLEQKLRVISVSLFFSPYIFIGLNGSQGWKFAAFGALFAISTNILIYILCEALSKHGILTRKYTNVSILLFGFLIPLLMILFLVPGQLFWTDSVLAKFLYQLFISSTHILLLLGFNLYRLLSQRRAAMLEHLERILQSREVLPGSSTEMNVVRDIELARYLHGEFQAGLVAASLLLERASISGDTEQARRALESAVDILSQDHLWLSQSKVAPPVARLEKIAVGWRGIATVDFSTDWIRDLEPSVIDDAVVLIDEAVANAIRHAGAANIAIDGKLEDSSLRIEIISDGTKMTHNAAGLGTRLFSQLADGWDYSRDGNQNCLRFDIRLSN